MGISKRESLEKLDEFNKNHRKYIRIRSHFSNQIKKLERKRNFLKMGHVYCKGC